MATSLGTVRCPLIIGRDALLDLADRRLDQVAAGDGHLLLVSGEAGVGKTRFLGAIEAKAIERGFVADWGYVAPQDHDVPAHVSILDLELFVRGPPPRVAAADMRRTATSATSRPDRGCPGVLRAWTVHAPTQGRVEERRYASPSTRCSIGTTTRRRTDPRRPARAATETVPASPPPSRYRAPEVATLQSPCTRTTLDADPQLPTRWRVRGLPGGSAR